MVLLAKMVSLYRVICTKSVLYCQQACARALPKVFAVGHERSVTAQSCSDCKDYDVQVIFFPSHGDYRDPSITRRVMDYMSFMNSKTLFTIVRKDQALHRHLPVTIHVNFHSDKHPRMLAVVQRYVHRDIQALDSFPDAST